MKRAFVITVLLPLMLVSCRKQLCQEHSHPHGRSVRVIVDYSHMDYIPAQMRIDFYDNAGAKQATRFITPSDNIIELPVGEYKAICYNDNSEYMQFRNENSYENFSAYMPQITRSEYNAMYMGRATAYSSRETASSAPVNVSAGGNVPSSQVLRTTIGQPDLLFSDHCSSFAVTEDAASQADLYFTPLNITVVYHINVTVSGMKYVKQARGTMTGVSQAKFMYNCQRNVEPATVMFDCTREETRITTSMTAFGIIGFNASDDALARMNELRFEFLLRDGSTYTESFDIRALLTEELCAKGGTIDLGSFVIEIPEVDDGGFNAILEDWYDEETIHL